MANTQALIGFARYYVWPPLLNGPTQLAPVVTGLDEANLTPTTVDLLFHVDPSSLSTTLVLDYTSSLDGSGNPNFTVATSIVPGVSPVLTAQDVDVPVTGLSQATTYYFRVRATNIIGTTTSATASFTTPVIFTGPPIPVTGSATLIGDTSASLNGTVNPQNLATNYYFEYGTSSTLATFTSTADTPLAPVDLAAHAVSVTITSLSHPTTYYYRVHAYNAAAPDGAGGVDGAILSFTTPVGVLAPVVVTGTPTTTRATQIVVPGTVDPKGGTTTWKAQASTDGFSTVFAETSPVTLPDPTSGDVQAVSGTITGLSANTAYSVRIQATNSAGTTNGSTASKTTESLPTVVSPSSSSVTATSATIAASFGHTNMSVGGNTSFEYGLTTGYGTVAKVNGFSSGAANPFPDSANLSGLTPSTTYHWRANVARADADNTVVHLADQTFTTSASGAIIVVTTPSAYGPSSTITTSTSSGVPAYTVQVAADGTLHRSDTHAGITIAGNKFTGTGTLIIESDTPGTLRTPAASVLDQVMVQGPKLILRELTGATNQGAFEVNNTAIGVDFALEFQGCNGIWKHGRAVAVLGGSAIRLTKSPSGLFCGNNSGSWPTWVGGFQVPDMTIENYTGQCDTGSTGSALQIDGARNVWIGGFDAGSQSTYAGPVAAPLATYAVRMDAALNGGTKTDVQDVYITTASDTTVSMLSSKSGTYTCRFGTLKRSGIQAATFPNTLHQRPEKPIWFELLNGTQPGAETSVNCTNAGVIAEHFVLRNALSQNLVTSTFRDGATKDMQYEVRCDIYDPAVSLTLWTPADQMDTWPNGAKRFITVNGVKRCLVARPSSTYAKNPDNSNLTNRAVMDHTWTHMGAVAADGITEIQNVIFDPDHMQNGTGTAGLVYTVLDPTKDASQVTVTSNTAISETGFVTLNVTGDLSKWDRSDGTNGTGNKRKTITGATNASPIVITATAHGFVTGDQLAVSGVVGNTAANGDWTITNTGANTFSLNGSTGNGAYTSGGTACKRTDLFGIYTGHLDANLGANGVDTGFGYRRQLSYADVDVAGNRFLGVRLVPGPSGVGPVLGPVKVMSVTAGVAETFWPHGMPTGEVGNSAGIVGLTDGSYTITRVDDFHFSINGHSGLTWAPGPGTVGTFTPTTTHTYGLTGCESPSITFTAGTTLDATGSLRKSSNNQNFGQGTNNAIIHVKAGDHLRFVNCTWNDISLVSDYQDTTHPTIIELVDCDGGVVNMPGRFDYDSVSNLGVAGKYDRFNQHLPARTLVQNNLFGGSDGIWYTTRLVFVGGHGDMLPGRFRLETEHQEMFMDQASPAGTNSKGASNIRNGIGSNLPQVQQSPHGDVCQWFQRATGTFYKSCLAGAAHSVFFGNLDQWEQHIGCTLSNDGTGRYLVTLPTGDTHNFDGTGFDTVVIANGGSLNGEHFAQATSHNNATLSTFVLTDTSFPATGNPTTCDTTHSQHLLIPGVYRSVLTTVKHVDTSDRTWLNPMLAPGNLTLGIEMKLITGAPNDGSPPPAGPKPIIVAGIIEYRIKVWDSWIDNGGNFEVPDPRGNTSWIDLGANRNAFTSYFGSGVPGATATLTYT